MVQGMGMPRTSSNPGRRGYMGRGDLVIVFDVRFPSSALNGEQARKLRQLLAGGSASSAPQQLRAGEHLYRLERVAKGFQLDDD